MEVTMLSMVIVFWFGTAIIHSFSQTETKYSKTIVWLSFVTITSLIIGQLL